MLCPCDTGNSYALCCEPYHKGEPAPTALTLMRSRFSAFALRDSAYLLKTLHPDFHANSEESDLSESLANTDWKQLHILSAPGDRANEANVKFSAYYQHGTKLEGITELSSFIKVGQQWLYTEGELEEAPTLNPPSRNSHCWCQSAKKYKRCHGAT